MFRTAAQPAGASAQYGQIDLNARIAGASPHGLVTILFEELLKAMTLGQRATRPERRSEALSHAVTILQSLNDTLDFEAGGQIAASLSSVYGEARRLVLKSLREADPAPLAQAAEMIGEIAQSWRTIAENAAVRP